MPGRRIGVLDVRELVRRIRLGEKERRVARDLGVSRNTVSKYRNWAKEEGFLSAEELPGPEIFAKRLEFIPLILIVEFHGSNFSQSLF